MYKNNKLAFTFVELIVVITILAILATIGFGTYQSYLAGGRDTNRLIQLSDIHDGLERYSVNSRLPSPNNMVEIQANGNIFAYQGYAGEGVIKTIGYDGGGRDIEHGNFFTYMLSDNKRRFQLLTYIDDGALLTNVSGSNVYANQDYANMFPKVIGTPLGISIDKTTKVPIQDLDFIASAGFYDIVSGTGQLVSYFSDNETIDVSKGDDITLLLPNKSCNRIQKIGGSKGNGEYIINPSANQAIKVYCNMEKEGEGWTRVFSHDSSDGIFFADNADALEKNKGNPSADLYSILSDLDYFKEYGRFNFWLYYPELGGENIWSQTSNPTSEAINGYIPKKIDYSGGQWGGILPAEGSGVSLIDGSIYTGSYYYLIGAQLGSGGPRTSFSGPYDTSVSRVELYIK